MNSVAPDGQVYVCLACGKRSKDRYGDTAINKGWDASCMLNSKLCHADKLTITDDRVTAIAEGGFVETSSAALT